VSLFGGILSNMGWGRNAANRSSQRYAVLTPARIRPELVGGEWTDCMLNNLSGGGASIQARLDLKRGEHVDLRLKLGLGHDVAVRARVVFASAAKPHTRSTFGVRFTDLAYPDCQALTAYLALRDSASRRGARLHNGS
jgi:PilZ domain